MSNFLGDADAGQVADVAETPAPAKPKPKPRKKATKKVIKKAAGKSKAKAGKRKRRPKNMNAIKNKLYKLLNAKMPAIYKNGGGEFNAKLLIKKTGMSPEGVYKWLRTDHLPAKAAMKLIKLSKNAIKPVDLIPFVFV